VRGKDCILEGFWSMSRCWKLNEKEKITKVSNFLTPIFHVVFSVVSG
jgi:hypothetical protein